MWQFCCWSRILQISFHLPTSSSKTHLQSRSNWIWDSFSPYCSTFAAGQALLPALSDWAEFNAETNDSVWAAKCLFREAVRTLQSALWAAVQAWCKYWKNAKDFPLCCHLDHIYYRKGSVLSDWLCADRLPKKGPESFQSSSKPQQNLGSLLWHWRPQLHVVAL